MLTHHHDDVIRLIDDALCEAITKRASDIHIEPNTHGCRVRLRIDGILHCTKEIPYEWKNRFITRIKILANLDIAETRRPQDGRLHFRHNKNKFNCRISTCPTINGEKIVVRILYDKLSQININQLGLLPNQLTIVKKNLQKPNK